MNTIKELSRNLNSLRDGFNSKHLSITGKYSGLDKDFAEKETKRERALIHELTLPKILLFIDEIQPTKEQLKVDKAKARTGFDGDKQQQINNAIAVINGKPNINQIEYWTRWGLDKEYRAFTGTLLDFWDSNPFPPIEIGKYGASVDVIQKAKAFFDEKYHVADIQRDLDELQKIENRANNFLKVTREAIHSYMFFPDMEMTKNEIDRAYEYMDKNHQVFSLEQRIAMAREISQSNPTYRIDNKMEWLPEPRWGGKGIQYTPPVEIVE